MKVHNKHHGKAAAGLAIEKAAVTGYRICAETRHVTLGQQVEEAIRATPEAPADAPEVAKLIREAEARGMERAALRVRAWHNEAVHPTYYVNMLLREAAAIRAKDTP